MKTDSAYDIIWTTVKRIPKGKVSSYGQISRIAGLGENARLVGYALHNIPKGTKIPWHRVVNSQGRISLPKKGGHYERQRRLLKAERIIFIGERIDMARFEWIPEE